MASFNFDPSVSGYAITMKEFCGQNGPITTLCTGIVVFNNEGKLLLVQRASDEAAFPNIWVCILHDTLSVRY